MSTKMVHFAYVLAFANESYYQAVKEGFAKFVLVILSELRFILSCTSQNLIESSDFMYQLPCTSSEKSDPKHL